MINKYILLLLCGTLFSGCSAVSNRYAQKENKEEKRVDLRYSQNNTAAVITDSLYYDEDDEFEEDIEPAPEDEAIDISEVMNRFSSKKNEDLSAGQSTVKEKTLMEIIKYLNTPYKFGGNSKNGIDCSAFTQNVFSSVVSAKLHRTAREQYTQGISVDKSELQFGDLVFFNTRRRVRPGHVGIYIGENLFAHASSKHGVIVSSMDHDYYTRTYMGARRVEINF
jgi:cell wall-associated NlpC family hydrolase